MAENKTQAATENRHTIAEIGRKSLYNRVLEMFPVRQEAFVTGPENLAATALFAAPLSVTAQYLMLEGVDFDLSYYPLKFAGYKAVVGAYARVAAMNARPRMLTVSVGLSQRFYVEDVDALFGGMAMACSRYGLDMGGLEIKSSYTGITLCVTAMGEATQGELCRSNGASDKDLICLSGSVGAAYMGLKLLEREKRVFTGEADKDAMPNLKGYEFILEKYLKPEFPFKLLDNLRRDDLVPSSMTLTHLGLGTAVLRLAAGSGLGAKIFLEKIPIARECFDFAKAAQDETVDPLLAALGGGEDYELLFTLPLGAYEKLSKEYAVDIIGHMTPQADGCRLVSPDGNVLDMGEMGF